MHDSKPQQYEQFFHYTSGRWLWNEEKELRARYVKLNVEELKRIAAESIGGYNKVFKLVIYNSSVAIARIPCPNSRPAFKTTASEVATMEFVRTILNIPGPKVHAWSAVADNLDSFPRCKKAEVSSDVSVELKKEVEEHAFWRKSEHQCQLNGVLVGIQEGIFMITLTVCKENTHDYLKALANDQIKWLSQHTVREAPIDIFQKSDALNSPNTHIALYKKYLGISPYIFPNDKRMTRSTLWHWDMHAPNFFQSTWAGPLFLQYRYPKLVDHTGEVLLRLHPEYRDLEKSEKDRVTNQVKRSINPLLVEVNDIPHGVTRRQTIEFAEDTWEGDILPFRQCLIRLERHWGELGFDVSCPIHLTEEDIQNHMRDGERWNEEADFWDGLEGFVARGG
ncbi:hypothetical protein B0O99DRAFT_654279 [Bisporella sp. PMI_857]|nr:hypothetical protein B0O99DRAFT_654279 [Bisporella sp. PMI_857]